MRSRRLALLGLVVAASAVAACGPAGLALAEAARRLAERVTLTNYPPNRYIRMLDGQWRATHLAMDGNVYLGGGAHNPDLGAAFLRSVIDVSKDLPGK